MGAIIASLLAAVGVEIAAETAVGAAVATAEYIELGLLNVVSEDVLFSIGQIGTAELALGGAGAADFSADLISLSSFGSELSELSIASSEFTDVALTGSELSLAAAGSGVETVSLGAVSAASGSGIALQTSAIGPSLIAFVSTGAIIGFSYGVINLALGSGAPKAVPLQPTIANRVLRGQCIENIIDVLSGIHKCRDGGLRKVRMAARKKRHRSLSSAEASGSSSNPTKRVRRKKRAAPKSRAVAIKKKSVR